MPRKNTAADYLRQLERDHPAIYADYRLANYPSVNAACYAAGIKKPPTPLQILKREWRKATTAERKEFVRFIKAEAAARRSSPKPPARPSTWPVDGDGRLLPDAATEIDRILAARSIRAGMMMVEMGFKSTNQSVMTRKGKQRLDPDVVRALKRWLSANRRYR